ncbi:MAG: 4-phosphopantoate--beta-alanine ligase, partial [Steroidobacteraceae bacterium]|nr:4-phosphopantoate--beta-alanine ligase [Steroidobacteraceae bacterium]
LAMSSRNQYLDAEQRRLASAIYRQLQQAAVALKAGERDFSKIEATGRAALDGLGFKTDYFSVRDARSLQPATPGTKHFVVLTASRLGKARLIDNVQVAAG